MNYRKIITGATGSGKTYKAITDCKQNGERFIYYSPCKQLVIESYTKYGDIKKDAILTGEVNIKNKNGNIFTVYEINGKDIIESVDTVIVDEAHYITESDRPVKEIIKKAIELDKNIVLLTSTLNFEITDYKFEVVELKGENQNIKVLYGENEEDVKKVQELIDKEKYQTLCFCQSVSEFNDTFQEFKQYDYIYDSVEEKEYIIKKETYGEISGNITLKDKLIVQQQFAEKSISFLNATTCVAQGLNFPCELVIIKDSRYLTKENLVQMIGRLGRGLTDRPLYVYIDNIGYDTYYRENYKTDRVKNIYKDVLENGFDTKKIHLKDVKIEESKENSINLLINEIADEMIFYSEYKNKKSLYIQAIDIMKRKCPEKLTREAVETQIKYIEELKENEKFFKKFIEMKSA